MEQELLPDVIIAHREDIVYPLIPAGTNDELFILMWLKDRPARTQRIYGRDATRFLFFLGSRGKGLRQLDITDLQDFSDTISYLKSTSKRSVLNAVKSLLSFAYHTGYRTINAGAFIRMPKIETNLAYKILPVEKIMRIIFAGSDNLRDHTMLRFLYNSGCRASELCALTWRDIQDRENEQGQVSILGKGSKPRNVLLRADVYQQLKRLRVDSITGEIAPEYAPIFVSRGGGQKAGGGHLDPSQVHRIVEKYAVVAKVEIYEDEQRRTDNTHTPPSIVVKKIKKSRVSPHWFRHAHVSHALDAGVPPHIIMETVGHASLNTMTVYAHAQPGTSSALYLSA